MKVTIVTAAFLLGLCSAASAQTAPAEPPSGNQAGHGGHKVSAECKSAIEQTCPGVKPGDGRIKECLKQHNTTFKALCPNDVPQGGHHGQHANSGAPSEAPVAQAPTAQ